MAGVATESGLGRSFDGVSSGQQQQLYQYGEELAEWRSSEQVESGSSVTSTPYWDSNEDDDGGPKPSELYGKYTWKIDKFSQINKRELRSDAFEVGGYKWYILIYPQGCDVCNHLSLFLCVANHDKLLPGWSHFAQFTIAVVNKDPKKSKYSDTLHRFWKKEHDWGWKKFMEISKVLDGFIDADTLIIKAQVQVIRERADRPFRCLDFHYRRELVRVYLTNVEQICWRFVEERRSKLGKLIEDKARWSSFCSFWMGMDQNSRNLMSREKTESILKVVVKHFFIEKEVTSTLVMDSLYSGLKALEGQNKGKKNKGKHLEAEEMPIPIVCIEKDMFILVDDVLLLLARAAMEPLPPKDEKGPQNRTKDGTNGEEFNKDSIERDESRLTELGRRTIEIFVFAHIFSKIEVAYQEAVALKKQEELIREEEAAWLAESEQRARRGAADKEKKSKKKQGKQKRNNRKLKDKGRDEKIGSIVLDKTEPDDEIVERKDLVAESEIAFEKSDAVEDVSDASDSVDCIPESPLQQSEDIYVSSINCHTDTLHPPAEAGSSGISGLSAVQSGIGGRHSSVVDDSSSTCSSDSVPSVVMSVLHRGNSSYQKKQKSPSSGKNHRRRLTADIPNWVNEDPFEPSEVVIDARHPNGASRTSTTEEGTDSKSPVDEEVSGDRVAFIMSRSRSPSKSNPLAVPPKVSARSDAVVHKKQTLNKPNVNSSVNLSNSAENAAMKQSTTLKPAAKPTGLEIQVTREKLQAREVPVSVDKASTNPIPVMSRPLSAPLVSGPRPTVSMVSMVQTAPVLTRSVSAAGHPGLEPTVSTSQSYVPQSYRNAIMGVSVSGSSSTYYQNPAAIPVGNGSSHSYSDAPPLVSAPEFQPHNSNRTDRNRMSPSFSFGMVKHNNDMLRKGSVWIDNPQRGGSLDVPVDHGSLMSDRQSFDIYNRVQRSQEHLPSMFPACSSGRQGHIVPDEFPHLAIINELLDDEHGIGMATGVNQLGYQNYNNGPHHLSRHYSFSGDPSMLRGLGMSDKPPCSRYDRSLSYHDDLLQHGYGVSARSYDSPQSSPSPQAYANGQIDGYMANQWHIPSPDIPFPSVRHSDEDGYPYRVQEYHNMNGYRVFRPSNGH